MASCLLSAQELRIGVQGGEPFGNFFLQGGFAGHFGSAEYTSKPVVYTVGPTGEFGSAYLSLQGSALYQRFHYTASGFSVNGGLTNFSMKTTGDAWSFPILLKWRPIRRHPAYLVGGPVVRHLGGLFQIANSTSSPPGSPNRTVTTMTSNPSDLKKRWYPGLELGGGWNFQFSKIGVAPEVRYIRWTASVAEDRGALPVRLPLQFPPNQIELLVGVTYRIF